MSEEKEQVIIPPGVGEDNKSGKEEDQQSFIKKLMNNIVVATVLMILGIIYFLNPTGGVIELIPDNIPVIGNLDEAGAAFLIWNGIKVMANQSKAKKEAKAKKTGKPSNE